MTDYRYSVVLEPQDDGGFTAFVPALPEVVTEGEDKEEAIRAILAFRRNHGLPIPI